MHVITDTNVGGAGTYLLNLLTQPAFESLDVIVACPDGELGRRLDAAGIPRCAISGRDVSFSLPLVRELLLVIRKVAPDVVHTHSSLSGRIASKLAGVAAVYTKHNIVRIPGSPSSRTGLLTRISCRAASAILGNKVIAVSGEVARDLVESGIASSLIVTIPNGIDLDRYRPRDSRDPENASREVVVGTAARLHPQKALDVFLRAARLVADQEPSVKFLIAGTGPLEAELRALARSLDLGSSVSMIGFIDDMPGFLKGLDVYALSSGYEGLPMAVLEAMASGLPVVATRVGGIPEAVIDGVTGILVPPGDPAELARAILKLAWDRQLAERMGQAGRKRAEEAFSASGMAEKTVEVYLGLVR